MFQPHLFEDLHVYFVRLNFQFLSLTGVIYASLMVTFQVLYPSFRSFALLSLNLSQKPGIYTDSR